MDIRVAELADIETLFDIRTSVRENHQSRQELAEIGVTPQEVAELMQSHGRAWVAEIDGIPVGFSFANAAEETVFGLFVRPEYERRGAGRALLTAAEQWLFAQDIEEIWLLTDTDTRFRAYGFYQHMGWRLAGLDASGELKLMKRKAVEDDTLSRWETAFD